MANSKFEALIKKAEKRAEAFGGVLPLLLVTRRRDLSNVTFDRKTGRFSINGKIVPISVIRRQLNILEDKIGETILLYMKKLQSGEWTVEKWKEEMIALTKESHLLFGLLAFGSAAAVLESTTYKLRTSRDETALAGFALDVKKKKVPTLAMKTRRGRAYLNSFYITYSNLELSLKILAGYREAYRLLRAKESCEGCIQWGGRWIPINQMPALGTLNCGQFCKCYLMYR